MLLSMANLYCFGSEDYTGMLVNGKQHWPMAMA
jgi:hypothetical protein